jgi:hypothetical protein
VQAHGHVAGSKVPAEGTVIRTVEEARSAALPSGRLSAKVLSGRYALKHGEYVQAFESGQQPWRLSGIGPAFRLVRNRLTARDAPTTSIGNNSGFDSHIRFGAV